MPCMASGYHRPASFHKDDNHARLPGLRSSPSARAVHSGHWPPKLLNIRDFRTRQGFLCKQKRATIHFLVSRMRASVRPIYLGMAFHAKMRHWPGQFRAYMLQTHP